MDNPSYEQINLINQRLASLQQEVIIMESEYGFSKEFKIDSSNKNLEIKKSHNQKFKSQKENSNNYNNESLNKQQTNKTQRYSKLPQIQQITDDQDKITNNPIISQTWKQIFNEKPSLNLYYDTNRFLPVYNGKNDLKIKEIQVDQSQENFNCFYMDICKDL